MNPNTSTTEPPPLTCGVVYAVTGERFRREAEVSARTVRRHMPKLSITIHTDSDDFPPGLFDQIFTIDQPTFSIFDKLFAFQTFHFDKTIFLDSDTYVCRPFPELFELLDRFDFASTREFWSGQKEQGPICYDDYNSGVVLFRRNEITRSVLDCYFEACVKLQAKAPNNFNDQRALRTATYANFDLQTYVLPPQYNLRLTATQLLNVWATPVILHGHTDDFTFVEKQLLLTHDHRLLLANFSSLGRLGFAIVDRRMARFIRPALGVVTAFARLAVKSKRLLPGSRRITPKTKPS